MSAEITAEELAALRVPLRSLPGWVRSMDPYGSWIDLARAHTADTVARFVAGLVGVDVGCCAPSWEGSTDGWRLTGPLAYAGNLRLFTHRHPTHGIKHTVVVPSLAGLNPLDERRLDDGSLYVDRLALALVAAHVAGAS